jgi:hypothetical protein
MATIAPRGTVRGPADLGKMEFRVDHISEDFAAYIQAAHDINRAMSLELHAASVLVRKKVQAGARKRGIDRFAAAQAARRSTRPLLKAASLCDSAANQCLRSWRAYLIVITEIQSKNGRTRGGGL